MIRSIQLFFSKRLSQHQKSIGLLFCNSITSPTQIKKHLNLYKYEKKVMISPILSFVPPVFAVTITEQCNLRCPTCLYLLENKSKFHNAYISIESFKTMLEKTNIGHKAKIIFLTGGEPLLHPNIGELISIAKKHNFTIKISTNGILIVKRISELNDVDYINVSIDSYDYDSFLKNRGGTLEQFDLIKEGIQKLKDLNKNFSLSFVLTSNNVNEVDKMIALAEELMPPSIYFHNINPHGCENFKPLTMQDPETRKFLADITKKTNYPFDINISSIFDLDSPLFKESKCIQPWYYFCFNHKGDVAYCCHLSHNPAIGNVFERYDFNSPEMIQFRQHIIEGKIQKSCVYCQRRFMNTEFGTFNTHRGKWYINKVYEGKLFSYKNTII